MQSQASGNFLSSILKGVLTALICALLGVLIFSAVIKFAFFGDGVIKAVNQFIKVISVFIGCIFTLKNNMGFIKGMLVGGLFSALIYLVFSLIGASVSFGQSFIFDLIFGSIVGGISGIISVNLRHSN